jgi:GNAT superfamily N-acetyltransferase
MQSELLTLSGLSFLTEHDRYIVQKTPTEPDYWVGNQLILQTPDFSYERALEVFEHHFPTATHRSIVWDIPDMNAAEVPAQFAENGFVLDDVDALVLTGELRDVPLPEGIAIRPIISDADWDAALDLQHEVGIEEGFTQPTHRDYLRKRNEGRRVQIAKGLGQWFGAFEGGSLVCQMGMFHDDTVARYQSVETRFTHRRRGICSALLRHAAHWVQNRASATKIVIVAELGSDAGRLYRSMGFAHVETIHGVIRSGY